MAKCKICKTPFKSKRIGQKTCEIYPYSCSIEYGKGEDIKDKRKTRMNFKRKDKSILKDNAQKVMNQYVRLRDGKESCISCGHTSGRQWHAGHYESVGGNQQLRYNLWNIHKQCSICNNHKSGNLVPYRKRLIDKIGLEKVEWLESNHEIKKYTVEYLTKLIKVFKKKITKVKKNITLDI